MIRTACTSWFMTLRGIASRRPPVAHDDCPDRCVIRRLAGRHFVLVAWVVVVGAYIHPPHGTGIPICWLKSLSGFECPGCGLTRSISCAARGMFHQSWEYHPFGILLWIMFLTTALLSLLPPTACRRVHEWLRLPNDRLVRMTYGLCVASFLAFGLYRALAHGQIM